MDSIEKNTLSNAGAKPKVRAQAKKVKCPNKVKAHGQLPQGRSDVNDAPVSQRRGYVPPPDRLRHELNIQEVTYNELSPIQWMASFCRTIQEESDMITKEHMLEYVIHLLDDATDFSLASAKASHAVLLCRMEQGEIAGW